MAAMRALNRRVFELTGDTPSPHVRATEYVLLSGCQGGDVPGRMILTKKVEDMEGRHEPSTTGGGWVCEGTGAMDQISAEQMLAKLGIALPSPTAPVAAYIPVKKAGNLLFVSGQVPFREGKLIATGPVPSVVPLETAQECARQCVLNGLAQVKSALGSLDRVTSVVRVGVFVQCDDGYTEQPKVGNGASELLVQIFGEAGRHARAAVGTNALPLGACVEVEFVFEVN